MRFSDDEADTKSERDRIFQLEDEVIAVVEESGVGEFDGNEICGGYFTLYMYGPSAPNFGQWSNLCYAVFNLPQVHTQLGIMASLEPTKNESIWQDEQRIL